jgi:hypothetical protein
MMDIASTVFNSDKDQLCFDINAKQYLSFYKSHLVQPVFPVQATLNPAIYKNKKPLSSNNSIVSVKGILTHVDIDEDTRQPLLFHITVDHIGFLRKSTVPI